MPQHKGLIDCFTFILWITYYYNFMMKYDFIVFSTRFGCHTTVGELSKHLYYTIFNHFDSVIPFYDIYYILSEHWESTQISISDITYITHNIYSNTLHF